MFGRLLHQELREGKGKFLNPARAVTPDTQPYNGVSPNIKKTKLVMASKLPGNPTPSESNLDKVLAMMITLMARILRIV